MNQVSPLGPIRVLNRFGLALLVCVGLVASAHLGLAQSPKDSVNVLADNVNTKAEKAERAQVLWGLINTVVNDVDMNTANMLNKKKFVLHVAWHEGARLTTRVQGKMGPARSFYQLERSKAIDGVKHAQTNGWVDRLASSSGATQAQLVTALAALEAASGPFFPANNLIEEKLRTNDLFGTYMARIAMKRNNSPIGLTNAEHAEYWATNWKVSFPDNDRATQVATFITEANEVDGLIPESLNQKTQPEYKKP